MAWGVSQNIFSEKFEDFKEIFNSYSSNTNTIQIYSTNIYKGFMH